ARTAPRGILRSRPARHLASLQRGPFARPLHLRAACAAAFAVINGKRQAVEIPEASRRCSVASESVEMRAPPALASRATGNLPLPPVRRATRLTPGFRGAMH